MQRDAQRDDLDRLTHCRHSDTVIGPIVLDGLNVGVACHELEGQTAHADDGFDVAIGLARQQKHVGDAAGGNVNTPRQQGIIVDPATHNSQPAGLEPRNSRLRGVLLDELVVLHQQHRRKQ